MMLAMTYQAASNVPSRISQKRWVFGGLWGAAFQIAAAVHCNLK
jgi:hypothetical protein